MAQMRAVRLEGAALILVLLVAAGCKRESPHGPAALTASLIFDNASSEVRKALASRVDFRLDDDNFARWTEAQTNLEELPRSEIRRTFAFRDNAVDGAVARLESNPLTRHAIESAGLSVRDFVLETIALAQASEAAQTGTSTNASSVPPENLQFVQRYSSRVLRSQGDSRLVRAGSDGDEMQSDAAEALTDQIEMQIQMQLDRAEHEVEMRLAEAERQREEALNAAERRREEAEMRREEAQHRAEMRREEANERRERRAMMRDTVPILP